jgi:DNA repair protein RecO (recombination protein O)
MIVKGIVLKITELEEKGRILTVLTENGLMSITARGAKKPTSKNNPAAQCFSYADFSLTQTKGRFYLESSNPLKIFWGLAKDFEKLALAAYFSDILCYIGTGSDAAKKDAADELKTMLLCLDALEKRRDIKLIKPVFEMRVASSAGFLPDLIGCAECYKYSGGLFFDLANGQLFCAAHNKNGMKISESLLDTMRFVCLSPVEKILNFKIGEETTKAFNKLAENYLIYHLAYKPETLIFYKKTIL